MNDKDDPYLTDDGQLVFAVPRAPVDGGPCLVSLQWPRNDALMTYKNLLVNDLVVAYH